MLSRQNDKQKTHEGEDIGLIAQNVQEFLPEIVTKRVDGYLGIKYERMVPVLVEAIKEQGRRIESLEDEVRRLLGN